MELSLFGEKDKGSGATRERKEYTKEFELTSTPSAVASPPCGSEPPSRPPSRRCPASGLLRPTAEQARRGATLLPAAPSRRCSGGTRAAARRRLTARDDFGLVIVRPVVEADSKPGAACFAAGLATARLGVVVHSGRPQVGVLQIMLRPVGDESALRVRPACRPKKRALSRQAD